MELGGRPIKTLEGVPIYLQYVGMMTYLLGLHGATVEETRNHTHRISGGSLIVGYKEFKITFPDGTKRVDKDVIRRTTPFSIYFPDGYELTGVDIYPGYYGPDDPGTSILYLPRHMVKK